MPTKALTPVTEDDHVLGAVEPEVTVVEFGLDAREVDQR